jgi:hypothetical protein
MPAPTQILETESVANSNTEHRQQQVENPLPRKDKETDTKPQEIKLHKQGQLLPIEICTL